MVEIPLLHDILVIFGLSIFVLLLMHRFNLPAIVGYILTGILCGPYGLGLVKAEEDVQVLANIGIVLLLFIVGMEFSFKKIFEERSFFLMGGAIQVLLTVLGGLLFGLCLGRPFGESLYLGFLVALSSTAIVLRLLSQKMESDTPHGKLVISMMIFQDIIAIPMMLSLPLLSGKDAHFDLFMLTEVAKGILILAIVLFCAERLVPWLLYRIAKTRSKELFILSVLTICSSVAWVTSNIGLSLSLGAFLAGLIISESEYRTEAVGDIVPFQDIFTSFFFVSIGMLMNVTFFFEQPFTILFLSLGVLVLKAFSAGFSAVILGMPLRTVVLSAVAMSQIGEFSFVIAKEGYSLQLGSLYHYNLFLSVALITMAFTPTLMSLSPLLADRLQKFPLPLWLKSGLKPSTIKPPETLKEHVIIVGFGISGRNLARSTKEAKIPYVVLELNPDTVRKEKINGEPIYFGDASHETVLRHANISQAKVLAIVINDSLAIPRIVENARKINPALYIVVRTRYLKEMRTIHNLGADEVIPDEIGSSVEVFTRVLRSYKIPHQQIDKIVSGMRVEGYEMLRLLFKEPSALSDLQVAMSDVLIETYKVQEGSFVSEKSLGEVNLRKIYGVTAMLVRRGEEIFSNPSASIKFLNNDVVVLVGTHDKLMQAAELFKPQTVHQYETNPSEHLA